METRLACDAPAKPLIEQALAPFVRFSHIQSSGGLVLIACTVAALAWANSSYGPTYFALWETPVTVGFGPMTLSKSLHHWINDGLMAIFFFMVGLEIKREILVGELSSPGQAVLPVAAAIGGMAAPAALFALLNQGQPSLAGWGIPMATDIAFALGILSLLGNRIPVSLKVFLAAVAIVDDIGAVLVIAMFYSGDISFAALGVGGTILLAMAALNVMGARHPATYTVLGALLWLACLKSGVHATVAGVLAAMTIPARTRICPEAFAERANRLIDRFEAARISGRPLLANTDQIAALEELEQVCRKASAPLPRLEHALHPWVAYAVMPLFALANAGVVLDGGLREILGEPVSLGILVGLVVGKLAGIFLACLAMFRLGLAAVPPGLRLGHYFGVACLAGIGFTMSIFIAGLAFGPESALNAKAKAAILVASTVAGLLGYLILRVTSRGDDAVQAQATPTRLPDLE